tara:strand:+ start:1208 stop:1816 length:609 start_codon:yes stop_codon:yes gene_type:complete
MPNSGTEVDGFGTIKQLLASKSGGKTRDMKHYFYMLQMPDCGANRIKIGKSSNIYARFKYYQEHFHGDTVFIKDLRHFPNTEARFDSGKSQAMKLYALYEREAGYWLREFNKKKTKTGLGVLTEWFDADVSDKLIKKYEKFPDEFQKMKFDKTIKRQGLRSQTPYNVSDEEKSSSETETDEEEPIVRKSNRSKKKKIIRYKP